MPPKMDDDNMVEDKKVEASRGEGDDDGKKSLDVQQEDSSSSSSLIEATPSAAVASKRITMTGGVSAASLTQSPTQSPPRGPVRAYSSLPELPSFPRNEKEEEELEAPPPTRPASRGVSMSGIDLRNISPERTTQGPDDVAMTDGGTGDLDLSRRSAEFARKLEQSREALSPTPGNNNSSRRGRRTVGSASSTSSEKERTSRSSGQRRERYLPSAPPLDGENSTTENTDASTTTSTSSQDTTPTTAPLTPSRRRVNARLSAMERKLLEHELPNSHSPTRSASAPIERRASEVYAHLLQRVDEEEGENHQQALADCDNAPPAPGAYSVVEPRNGNEDDDEGSVDLSEIRNTPREQLLVSPSGRRNTIAGSRRRNSLNSSGLLVNAVLVGEDDDDSDAGENAKAAAFHEWERLLEEKELKLKAWEDSLKRERYEISQLRRELGLDDSGRVKVVQAEVLRPAAAKPSLFRKGLFGNLNNSTESSYASGSRASTGNTTREYQDDDDDDESTRLTDFRMPATMAQIRDDMSSVQGGLGGDNVHHAQVVVAPTPGMIRFSRTSHNSVDLSRASILSKTNKRVLKDLLQRFEDEWSATYAELLEKDANTKPLAEIAVILEDSISVLDRRYRLQVYRQCFVGKEAVDFLVRSQLAPSRQDAVTIGRRLQTEMHLFEHVTGDHEFKDEDLFYKFIDPSQRRTTGSPDKSSMIPGNDNKNTNFQKQTSSDDPSTSSGANWSLEELAEKLQKSVLVKDRRYHFKTYRNVLVASEAVDFMVQRGVAATRGDAVVLGRRLQTEKKFWQHVVDADKEFEDDYLFFQFQTTTDTILSLDELSEKLQKNLVVKDRTYHLKSYKKCLVASEAVDYMVKRGIVATRSDAVELGKRLQTEKNFWEHVVDAEKEFDDEYLFFHFKNTTADNNSIRSARSTSTRSARSSSTRSTTSSNNKSHQQPPAPTMQGLKLAEAERPPSPSNERAAAVPTEDPGTAPTLERLLVIGRLLRGGLKLKAKTYRMKKYSNCFLASDAVDFVVNADLAASRDEATDLCQALSQEHLDIWRVLGAQNHLSFQDEHVWWYFSDGNVNSSEFAEQGQGGDVEPFLQSPGSVVSAKTPVMAAAPLGNSDKTIQTGTTRARTGDSSVGSSTLRSDSSTVQSKWTLPQMAEKLRNSLSVKNRRYHLKVYKDCFIASDAVDFMIGSKMAKTRNEAVELGRRLEQEYELWHHVARDHMFKDEYLFFRFSSGKKLRFDPGGSLSDGVSSIVDSIGHSARSDSNRSQGVAFLQDVAEQFSQGVNVGVRSWRLKRYRNVFVGCEAVDFLVQSRLATSREEAVELGRRLEAELKLFGHVTKGHAFKDEFLFYRFQGALEAGEASESISSGEQHWENSSISSFSRGDSLRSVSGHQDRSTLDKIAKALRHNVQVKNRSYHLKEYKKCFIGSEAVDYLVSSGFANTREEAVGLVKQLITQKDLITHVTGDHEFEDEYLFYRFREERTSRDSTIAEIENVIERLQRL